MVQTHPYRIHQAVPADLPLVVDLDYEAFAPYGTAEDLEVFATRLATFPEGFVVMEQDSMIVGYGTSEKWLTEREPALGEDARTIHWPDGRIFCITGMAVRQTYRERGYGLAILDHLIGIARHHNCTTIILETTHAQGLYLKRGFRVVRERQERGVVLSVMKLELDSGSSGGEAKWKSWQVSPNL